MLLREPLSVGSPSRWEGIGGRAPTRVLASAFALLSLACCGPSATPAPLSGGAREATPSSAVLGTVRARVRFGARTPLPGGLSASETLRPARFVEVRALDADGSVRSTSATDVDGIVSLDVQEGGALVVVTHFAHDGLEAWVTSDAGGRSPREHPIALSSMPAASGDAPIALDLSDAQPFAGALHLLDTLGHGLETVHAWRGVALPPIFAHWGRGETTEWSFYLGEVPEGSGRFGLVLMGGDPGAQASSDTDEHDEGIVLHELGHFVMDRLTGDSSIGGRHPPGELTEPGVAWEEGRASFFAVAALAASGLSMEMRYRDTIGIEPTGHCRVDQDVETPDAANPRGPGAQESVTAILWDLADGEDAAIPEGARLPDRDGDGVALGAAAVLEAMEAHWAEVGSYPALASFLDFLVRTGRVARPALAAMLARTGEPASLLAPESAWPVPLALGAPIEGRVDGLSEPAPSGGSARPGNGLDAVRAYVVQVDRAGMLEARLRIQGASGTRADQSQLAIELRDRRARQLDRVLSSGAIVSAVDRVDPGTYVVYVRDGGEGNRASYTLVVSLTPVGE